MPYFVFLVLLIFPQFTWSHQPTTNSYGQKTKWNYSHIPLTIHSNSSFPNGNSLITASIQEWNLVGEIQIISSSSGLNTIKFVEDSYFGSGVVGVTELNYDTSGTINYGAIYLNANRVSENRQWNMAYIPDVVTHELGHFLGLNHSEVSNSTMFFQNFPGQNTLSADDTAGLKSTYSSQFGTIKGFVKGGNHIGVLGVHVQAVSRKTGEIIGSISNEDGSFAITGLPLNDTYYLYTSPLKNLASLPRYYANVQTEFCPARYIGGFFTECSKFNEGLPQSLTLTSSNRVLNAGVLTIHCDLKVQESYMLEKVKSEFDPIIIFNYGDEQKFDKSFVGYFEESKILGIGLTDKFIVDLTQFPNPAGKKLKVRVLSHSLGSPIDMVMRIKQNGFVMGTHSRIQPFVQLSDVWNFDLVGELSLSAVSSANYIELEMLAQKAQESWLDSSYPGGRSFLQKGSLPYLIILSLEDSAGPLLLTESFYSDNASCLDAPFTYPIQKTGAFSDEVTISNGKNENDIGPLSCGTIDYPSGPSSGPFMGIMTLGFFLSLFLGQLSKTRKNILS